MYICNFLGITNELGSRAFFQSCRVQVWIFQVTVSVRSFFLMLLRRGKKKIPGKMYFKKVPGRPRLPGAAGEFALSAKPPNTTAERVTQR